MYFPILKKLKDSEFDTQDLKLFDSLLYLIYDKHYHERFSPRVYKYFGISVNENDWMYALEQLKQLGVMNRYFEVACPSSGETVAFFDKFDDLPIGKEASCTYCGEDFTVTEEDIFVTYGFEDELRPQKAGKGEDFFRASSNRKTGFFTS
jgi:hypothetical protein